MTLLEPSRVAQLRLFPAAVPITAHPPRMPFDVAAFGRLMFAPAPGTKLTVPPIVRLRLGIGLPPEAPNTRLDPVPFTATTDAPTATPSVPTVSFVPAALPLSVMMPPFEVIVL